jgi:hypothetical protein
MYATDKNDVLKLLKNNNRDISELTGTEIVFIAAAAGASSIPVLRENGINFSELDSSEIAFIIGKTGKESISLLKEAGYDFYHLFTTNLCYAIAQGGADLIPILHKNGARFGKLEGYAFPIIAQSGKKSIPLLDEVGFDFSKVNAKDFIDPEYINVDKKMIFMLVVAGVDLSKIKDYQGVSTTISLALLENLNLVRYSISGKLPIDVIKYIFDYLPTLKVFELQTPLIASGLRQFLTDN